MVVALCKILEQWSKSYFNEQYKKSTRKCYYGDVEMNKQAEDNSFVIKANKIEKFIAITGIVAQTAIIAREHYLTTPNAMNYIASYGVAYIGVIVGRHINPEKSMKKAAFLTLGAGAILAAAVITDFSGTNLKDTLLYIPSILTVAGFFPIFEREFEREKESKKPKI